MLLYKPDDVLYTLQVAAQMKAKDRDLRKNQYLLQGELKKTQKKKTKPIKEVVDRLYSTSKGNAFAQAKITFNEEELKKARLIEFGKTLSQAYQNAMRQFPEKRV